MLVENVSPVLSKNENSVTKIMSMKELTKDQIKLLCALIDGYAYPRFLTSCDPRVDTKGVWDRTKEFLEIRQVLDPNPNFDIEDEDTYPPHFQHGYWEHDDFDKLDGKVVSDKMSVHQFGYEIFNMFENYQSEYYLCDFKSLVTKIREIKKSADKLENLESVFQDLNLVNT